jgi:tetratricopeptide (TPR) repeat protein
MVSLVYKIVLVALTIFIAYPQAAVDPAIQEAERLTSAGAYDEAVTEYRRYLFFHPDSPAVPIYIIIADISSSQGNLSESERALESVLSGSLTDSLRDAIRIKKAIIDMAGGSYGQAQAELLRVQSFSSYPMLRDRARFFLCLAYVFAGEWDQVKKNGDRSNARLRSFDSIATLAATQPRKSVRAAQWMSTFLPGLGQVYAGDFRNGLNALAISCLTGFMTVHSIMYGYYEEAIFTDITLLWRYYSGNRWGARRAAEIYNGKRDRFLQQSIMDYLRKGVSSSSEKP